MRPWLIPTIALLIVALTGLGLGWSLNEWSDDELTESDLVPLEGELREGEMNQFRSDCLLASDTLSILQQEALGSDVAAGLKAPRDEACRGAQGYCTDDLKALHKSFCEEHSAD